MSISFIKTESTPAPAPVSWNSETPMKSENGSEDEINDEEEEIDQLASASEPEDDSHSSGPRRYKRTPGTTSIPAIKVENILQADGITGALSLSKEGLYVLSVATEEFIKRLVQGGHRQASSSKRSSINYRDMADTSRQYQEFMFLKEIIPYPMPLGEAMYLRKSAMKDSLGADFQTDATSASAPPKASSSKSHAHSSSKSGVSNKYPSSQSVVNGNGYTIGKERITITNGSSRGGNPTLMTTWDPRGGQRDVSSIASASGSVSASNNIIDSRPWTHWSDPLKFTPRPTPVPVYRDDTWRKTGTVPSPPGDATTSPPPNWQGPPPGRSVYRPNADTVTSASRSTQEQEQGQEKEQEKGQEEGQEEGQEMSRPASPPPPPPPA